MLPSLLDLARQNIKHYQVGADWYNALFYAGQLAVQAADDASIETRLSTEETRAAAAEADKVSLAIASAPSILPIPSPMACAMASGIEGLNTERKDLDAQITKEALAQIEELKEQERKTTVVFGESWHKGVIGIVASRLIETYYRPTLVFTKSGEKLAASARSVKGFDVYEALEGCAEHIEQFGGHKYAAGLTLLEADYEKFKQKFEEVVSTTIPQHLLTPEISVDLELEFDEVNPKFYRILRQFAPFGPGNMTPVFMSTDLRDTGYGKCVGADDLHLKCTVVQHGVPGQYQGPSFGAIGFNLGSKCGLIERQKTFKAVYSIDLNEWQGNVSLQLKLRDIQE